MRTVSTFEALLSGLSWNGVGVIGRSVIITFSFETAPAGYLTGEVTDALLTSFQAFSPAEQAVAREALKAWADASGITFIEVPAGNGDIRFGAYDLTLDPDLGGVGVAGVGVFPTVVIDLTTAADHPIGGDIFIDHGQADFDTLVHEVGHALGLKHPFDGEVVLDPLYDRSSNTVMSYDPAQAVALGPLDIAAITHLYGGSSTDGSHVTSWSWDAANLRLTQTGGDNADRILGVGVADLIVGGGGHDRVYSAAGADNVTGGDGNDTLSGGDGSDTLSGGAGDDVLEDGDAWGGSGGDVLDGGDGHDLIYASIGAVVDGGAGNDTLFLVATPEGSLLDYDDYTVGGGSYANIEYFGLQGSYGNDTLIGGYRDDELYAGMGDDSISGGDSWDWIAGDEGNDTVYGGADDDDITGDDGDDFLRGDTGDDLIWGGAGFDDSHGNWGEDTVFGSFGGDWVVGGQGNDLLYGGDEPEYLDYLLSLGISNGDSHDVVYGNLGADTVNGGIGNDWVRGGQGSDVVDAGEGDDFVAGDRGDDTLTGGLGADRFHSFAEAGLDRIEDFSLAQGDRLNLLAGTTYTLSQSGADTIVAMGGGGQVILVGVQLTSLTGDWITVG